MMFAKQPHGILLNRPKVAGVPVKVENFSEPNSYAQELGVKPGWSVVKIADRALPVGSKWSEVDHTLRKALQHLPPHPLLMVFQTGESSMANETMSFERSPLGLGVSHHAPFTVEHVDSSGQAAAEGVRVGWKVIRIGQHEIIDRTDPAKVEEWLESAEHQLPPEDYEKAVRLDVIDANQHPHVVHLDRHGHGVNFAGSGKSLQVHSFTCCSHGFTKNMHEGMQVLKIDNEDVQDQNPAQLSLHIHSKTEKLPAFPLKVVFETSPTAGVGKLETVYFERQPLGIDWTEHAPFKVHQFFIDSYAEEKGVKKNWTIKRIGTQDVSQLRDRSQLESCLQEGTDHLPQVDKGLEVEFRDPDGRRRIVRFARQPFGMVLGQSSPPTVKGFRFNSYAEERGIRKEWQIVRVHHERVQNSSPRHVEECLAKHANLFSLEAWPLRVEFKAKGVQMNSTKIVDLERKPHGIVLSHSPPFKVNHFRPDSHAEVKGVKLGWEVRKVGTMIVESGRSSGHGRQGDHDRHGVPHAPDSSSPLSPHSGESHGEHSSNDRVHRAEPSRRSWNTQGSHSNQQAHEQVIQGPQDALDRGSEHLPPMPGAHMVVEFETSSHPTDADRVTTVMGKHYRTFWLRHRPLGFTCDEYHRVQEFPFNSYAKDEGIVPGWKVSKVGHETVGMTTGHHQVNEWLHSQSADLPPWPLRIDFHDEHSDVKTLWFERADIGIDWSESLPMRVRKFEDRSLAKNMGVQQNWTVVQIGDEDIRHQTSLQHVKQLLEDGFAHLDHEYGGFTAVFDVPGRRSHSSGPSPTQKFDYMPSGIIWSDSYPPRVKGFEFNSYALHKGVEIGWTLKRLCRENVGRLGRVEVEKLWHEKELAFGLPHWPLKITFDTASRGCSPCGRKASRSPGRGGSPGPRGNAGKQQSDQHGQQQQRHPPPTGTNPGMAGTHSQQQAWDGRGFNSPIRERSNRSHIEWSDNMCTVSFHRQPLGMVLSMPKSKSRLSVKRVLEGLHEEDASSKNVEPHWVITHIGDQDLRTLQKEQIRILLDQGIKNLRYTALRRSQVEHASHRSRYPGVDGDQPPGPREQVGCGSAELYV
jgi:hypothetical protein